MKKKIRMIGMMLVWGVLLSIQTIFDVRWRRIPFVVTGMGLVIGVTYSVIAQREGFDVAYGLIPGVCCMVYSKISREALGYGDSLLLCSMGVTFELETIVVICMMAFVFASIGALIVIVFLNKNKQYEMPFVPFLMAAYVMWFIGEIGSVYGV